MYIFFESYYHEDTLIWVEPITFKTTINKYPNIYKIYNEIATELDLLNQLRANFMDKYKYVISFHPFYTIYNNIKHPNVSLHRKKEKFLDSRLTLSIASKSKAILVSFNNRDQVYIPNILNKKKVSIKNLSEFTSTSDKIFNKNKPTKDELNPIIETLTILNKKIERFIENKTPFTLLANEHNWNKVFFKI